MHILQMLPSLSLGGVERGTVDLTCGLIAKGHKVTVISSGGSMVSVLDRLGVKHFTLPVHKKSLLSILSCIPKVAKIIEQEGIDIVHARSRVPGWIGWRAAKKTQTVFLTTAHGYYSKSPGSRVMLWGKRVIAPSEGLAQYLIEHFGAERSTLRVIPRGVDLHEFSYQPPGLEPKVWRFGIISRLTRIKGHAVAFKACALLKQRGIEIQLHIVGDPPASDLKDELLDQAKRLGIQENIYWKGIQQDIPQQIAAVDGVLVPSVYPESFGRGVIEAQAVGRPVIASKLGALEQLVDHEKTGLQVNPGDADALANAMERFMDDPDLRERCIEEGRRQVEAEWSLEKMVERNITVYREALIPKVLIWKIGALGDVVLATASLRAVRKFLPQSEITLVVGRAAYPAVARCPYVDNMVVVDFKGKDRSRAQRRKLAQRLRAECYDISIDLQNSRRTHWLAWAARIRSRYGYDRKWGFLLNNRIPLPSKDLSPVAHQAYLLKAAGIPMKSRRLELWPSDIERSRADKLMARLGIKDPQHLIGFHPGGSVRWKTKRWPLERWQALRDALLAKGYRILVFGGESEVGQAQALSAGFEGRVYDAAGQTNLLELVCLMRYCEAVVCHDSLSLHAAACAGSPIVGLFGPTSAKRHMPAVKKGKSIQKPVFCAPCYRSRCWTLTHACMQRIAIEEVEQALEQVTT